MNGCFLYGTWSQGLQSLLVFLVGHPHKCEVCLKVLMNSLFSKEFHPTNYHFFET